MKADIPKFSITKSSITKSSIKDIQNIDTHNHLIIITVFILLVGGGVCVFLLNKEKIMRFLGLRTDTTSMLSEACKKEQKLYAELGMDSTCGGPSCSTGRIPSKDDPPTCAIDGMVVSTNLSGEKCCIAAGDVPDPPESNENLLRTLGEDGVKILISVAAWHVAKFIMKKSIAALDKAILQKTLEKIAEKTAEKFGGAMIKASEVGGTICAATGVETLGIGCGVGLIVTVLEVLGDVADFAGTNQYLDNTDIILMLRDQLEGALLDAGATTNRFPPFIFSIGQIPGLTNYDVLPDTDPLVRIVKAYQGGHTSHITSEMPKAFKRLPFDIINSVHDAIHNNTPVPDSFNNALADFESIDYVERDNYIWEYMKKLPELNIKGDEGDYVMYRKSISGFKYGDDATSKSHCGISLNEKGVEYYNKQVKLTQGHENSVISVVFSKYFRTIKEKKGKKNILQQNELPDKFPLMSGSMDTIYTMCNDGYDGDQLHDMYPIQSFFDLAPPKIKPKDYFVSYDIDKGVCKYATDNPNWNNTGYCDYMAKDGGVNIIQMPCAEGISKDGCSYQVCKPLSGAEKWVSEGLGLVGADWIVTDARRGVGRFEKWEGDKDMSIGDLLCPLNPFDSSC
jgi:hypothetical protein